MGKAHIIFLAISSLVLLANAEKLRISPFQGREVFTQFRFYVHDVTSRPNATDFEIARANITSSSPTSYGQLRVLDNKITLGPDFNSERLGQCQGQILSADMVVQTLTMYLNFFFTAGEYKGSTLTILGRNEILSVDRELPVVGGTGVFRWARGYVIVNTYSSGVIQYDFHVAHFEHESGFGLSQANK